MRRARIAARTATASRRSAALTLVVAATLALVAGVEHGSAAPHKAHHAPPSINPRDTDTSATGTLPAKGQLAKGQLAKGQLAKGQLAKSQLAKGQFAKAPTKQPQAPAATGEDDDALPPPFHLPQASHARMRDCGLKWQTMKSTGDVGEEIWRDFATRCLAAAHGPFDKHTER